MANCTNCVKTKKVGKCGQKLWLGTAVGITTEQILVTYFINGDEVSEMTDPIIQGNDIFLDLSDPYFDYYNSFKTYFISLTDANGYYSNPIPINNGGDRDCFIVNFGNVATSNARLVVV